MNFLPLKLQKMSDINNNSRYLFRGKVISQTRNFVVGDWAYGSLWNYLANKARIFTDEGWVEVDPSTVGQFTGGHDKNGKPIFECDVDKSGFVVKWNPLHFTFMLFNASGGAVKGLLCSPYKTQRIMYDKWTDDSIEIVGNQWDSPDLLK